MDKNDVIRLKIERLSIDVESRKDTMYAMIKATNCLSANKISTEFKFFNASHRSDTTEWCIRLRSCACAVYMFVC